MMHTTQALYDQLRANLVEVEMQIKHIKNDIAIHYPEAEREKLNVWYWTRKADGGYVLEEMLAAKTRLLSAMAGLKAAELSNQKPRGGGGKW